MYQHFLLYIRLNKSIASDSQTDIYHCHKQQDLCSVPPTDRPLQFGFGTKPLCQVQGNILVLLKITMSLTLCQQLQLQLHDVRDNT